MKKLLTILFTLFSVTVLFAQKSAEIQTDNQKHEVDNKIQLQNTILIGANISGKTIGAGFYNEIALSHKHNFDIGVGTAFEIMEYRNAYSILKIPITLIQNIHINKSLYFTFRPSFVIPINVSLYTDDYSKILSPLFYNTLNGKAINDPNELLKTGVGFAFGLIWKLNDEITFQLLYQNQPSCLYEPYSGRLDYFTGRFGLIL